MAQPGSSRELSRLVTIAVAVVVIAVLYLARIVVLPLALAIVFAFLLSPAVGFLEKIRIPRVPAILLVIATVFVLVCAIGWAVFTQLVEIANRLPVYQANITEKISAVHNAKAGGLSRAEAEVKRLGRQLGVLSSGSQPTQPLGSPERPISVKQAESSSTPAISAVHGVFRLIVQVLLVVVFAFFMLLQQEDLRNRLLRLTGPGELRTKTMALSDASRRISRYFILLLTMNAIYGFVIFVALQLIGLPHAWLFGVLTTLLRFIPYIGAPISALLPTALALAVFPGWGQALIVIGIFLCVELVTANYIEPRLYGKHTGLSPLAILVAALFWTLIWGPVGLILSVPLTVCVAVIGGHVPSLKFLNLLLGDQPALPPPAHYYQRLLAGDDREAGEVLKDLLQKMPLQDLYDAVLLPALGMAEHDRHAGKLDDATIDFIHQTTKDLLEECGECEESSAPVEAGQSSPATPVPEAHPTPAAANVVCMPVRDDADEIVAGMLVQLLTRAGHNAQLVRAGDSDQMMSVAQEKPDAVYLSALPPYARSHARELYRNLRTLHAHLPIVISLWNYPGDPLRAARAISGGEQQEICTTLADAVARAGRILACDEV